ncbi:MAG: hypothetical protein NZZ60_00740, partial [Bacteroidia bacterium]|nr:hypothetical protein [Bacteroidia bacterium]
MSHVVDTIVRNSQQRVSYPLLPVEPTSVELPVWGKEGLYFGSRHSPQKLLTEITEAVRAAKEVVAFQTLLLDDSPFIQELERAIKERG